MSMRDLRHLMHQFLGNYSCDILNATLTNAANTIAQKDDADISVSCVPYARDTWKLTAITRRIHNLSPRAATAFIQTCTALLLLYFKSIIAASRILIILLKKTSFQSRSVLILPPSFPGSFGDETMMQVTIEQMNRAGMQKYSYLYTADKKEWDFLDSNCKSAGVSLLYPWKDAFYPLSLFRTVQAIANHEYFFCIGADVMDGNYSEIGTRLRLELLRVAANFGRKSTLLGFSFNDHPVCSIVKDFQRLPQDIRLCSRDPISQKRLQICLNRNVDLVADTAFLLLSRKPDQNLVSTWIENERKDGRMIIGINPSIHSAMGHEKGANHIVDMYINTMIECTEANGKMSFLLIPHDARAINVNSDRTMATSILSRIPSELRDHVAITPEHFLQSELQYVCGQLDFAITGRMHLAIKCLNTGVPIFCIGYQDKFEGLLRMFDMHTSMISAEHAMSLSSLASCVQPKIQDISLTRAAIAAALPNVRTLAKNNYIF